MREKLQRYIVKHFPQTTEENYDGFGSSCKQWIQKAIKIEHNKHVFVIFMVVPCVNDIKRFIVQLIHSKIYKIFNLLKTNETYKSCSNMFRFTQEPSSGSHNQCLDKITSLVRLCVSVQTCVMAAYSDLVCWI